MCITSEIATKHEPYLIRYNIVFLSYWVAAHLVHDFYKNIWMLKYVGTLKLYKILATEAPAYTKLLIKQQTRQPEKKNSSPLAHLIHQSI